MRNLEERFEERQNRLCKSRNNWIHAAKWSTVQRLLNRFVAASQAEQDLRDQTMIKLIKRGLEEGWDHNDIRLAEQLTGTKLDAGPGTIRFQAAGDEVI